MTRNSPYKRLLAACLCACLLCAWGQDEKGTVYKPIQRTTMFGVGYADVYDNYLSPEAYTGMDFRIARESIRDTKWMQGKVSLQNFIQGNISNTHNRADNNNTLAALVNWNLALHYKFYATSNLRLLAGPALDMNAGFIYNMRNGNNPASARAHMSLDASGMAVWDTHIRRLPLTLRYQLSFPLTGIMFSPHYGQSYYEIFTLGNDHGVVKMTTTACTPSMRQMLSADFPIHSSVLRLGYLWDAQQSHINGIKTHLYSHCLMVGFVKTFYVKKKGQAQ